MSHIVGNFISSSVLRPDESEMSKWKPNLNCGASDCPGSGSTNDEPMSLRKPQMVTVYLLCAIYIGLGVMSILLIKLFLREYERHTQLKESDTKQGRFDLLISTITQMKERNQVLIIPITLWMGFSLGYMGADFTKSFVACSRGSPNAPSE